MSWDCYLQPDQPHGEDDYQHWSYTYNTSTMIHAAIYRMGLHVDHGWHELLHEHTGPEGGKFLKELVTEFESDRSYYESMNPSNGWGSYTGLLAVLTEMYQAVPEYPTHWHFP